jgi:hypothetical protein
MPRIASAQVKRRLNHGATRMDMSKKPERPLTPFVGFESIHIHLSLRSLGEGGFVVKMNIFVP